jgi:hypothetical protein
MVRPQVADGLEVNADKSEYMVMSRDQNARRHHNIKTNNNFFERLEELKYCIWEQP